MRRNYVVSRFRFLIVHCVERSLKLVLRVFDVAEDRRIKELTFVEDDISGDENAFANRIPEAIEFCTDDAEITALSRSWSDFVASADIFDRNACICDAAKLSKVTNSGSIVIIEPDFVRSSAVECSCRETISDLDSGVNGFSPERSRKTRSDHHGSYHIEECSIEAFCNAVR